MRSALSGQARERLEQELAALRDRRDRLAGQVRARDRVGDQADEAFSLRLDDDIAAMDDRIGELSELLASGRNVETGTHGVLDGTRVTLRFADGEVQTLQVVAVPEEIPAGQEDAMVTFDSPLGLALSGRAAGDTVAYSAPAGVVRAEIVSLEPPD